MRKFLFVLVISCVYLFANTQDITINGNKFYKGKSEIWFNGINTPWHLFCDFGRTDFNSTWWAEEFAKYKDNNINLARVWIHASGEVSPDIDATGHVSGASDLFWVHLDYLVEVATENEVYIMPALLSFDVTKDTYTTFESWRAWMQSESNIQSYIDNVLIPMVQRYDNEPYLFAWEICNEPEWMFENPEHGPQSFYDVQKMHAMFAAAIHENSTKPVTTGSAAPKWNSPIYDTWGDYEGNMFSDEALSASINNENAFLDFYQYHWYPWQTEWMESPFTQTTAEYGVDDRPVIVGESEGNDVCDEYICQTVSEMYESAYNNGFDGVCAWKTPQNDGHGTFENIAAATNAFYDNYPLLVYPDGSDQILVESIQISESEIEIQIRDSYLLSVAVLPVNATDKRISWTSSNSDVASIKNGKVTGIIPGTATIIAVTNDGGYTDSCVFTVTERHAICADPVAISLPYTQDGLGSYCFVVSGTINSINSWGIDYLEINGVDYANEYSDSMPALVDGKYYIYYEGSESWAHMEITGTSGTIEYADLLVLASEGGSVSPTEGSYPLGTNVSVTATPLEGYEFVEWSGDISATTSTVDVIMDSDMQIHATFKESFNPVVYELTVLIEGMGGVDPEGGTYEAGEEVIITAILMDGGYNFSEWTGDASGTDLTTSVTMDGDKTVTAVFLPIDSTFYYYTLNVETLGEGVVTPSTGSYLVGSQVTLTAEPADGYRFSEWTGDATGSSSTTTVVMENDVYITAVFVKDTVSCDDYELVSVPVEFNGVGGACFATTDDIAYISSWNMSSVIINGVDYTNTWSATLPEKQGGEFYYISLVAEFPWSHFEANGLKNAGMTAESKEDPITYPNPFTNSTFLFVSNPKDVDQILVFDQLGRKIESIGQSEISSQMEIGENYAKGLYIVLINSSKECFKNYIIIKE